MMNMVLNFRHLMAMSDSQGLFEHANFNIPRREHGYCVDDVARALIVLERSQKWSPRILGLRDTYFQFISDAQVSDGRIINRCDADGNWSKNPEIADHWGRALWAFGTMVNRSTNAYLAEVALERFNVSAGHRTYHLRSMVYASLGAAEVLRRMPQHKQAQAILADCVEKIRPVANAEWPWPESRLTYSNGAIPEVLMFAGHFLKRPELIRQGAGLLRWLVDVESVGNQFSVTPTSGWTLNQPRPSFDQQPIEVAALVDACATAFELTNDRTWLTYLNRGASWFAGRNDSQVQMYDPATGAGFDGLTPWGRNENQGAESTLCFLSVAQRRRSYLGAL
jgi:hypothetical protein